MNSATWWFVVFRNNWLRRHDPNPTWRRIHRTKARQAIQELRYLADRPTKRRNVPCGYGHGV